MGLVLFWVILRFIRIVVTAVSGPRRPDKGAGVKPGRKVGKQAALKDEDVIDVDYTESTSSKNRSESNKDHQ